MSVEAIAWVLNHAPVESPVSKLVLVALANHAHPDGSAAFPSVSTICRYTCLSERSVRQHLDNLEAQGIIRRCDPRIVAAYIHRADRRPIGYDLIINEVREMQVGKQRGAAGAANGVQEMQERGAGDAPKPTIKPSNKPYVKLIEVFEALLAETTPVGVSQKPVTPEWEKSFERLLKQGATPEMIEKMIRASFSDDWWRKNIRNPMQLEKYWERLVVAKSPARSVPIEHRDDQMNDAIVMVTNLVRMSKSHEDVMDYINGKNERLHEQLVNHYEKMTAKVSI